MIRVQHGHLTIDFLKNLFNHLIELLGLFLNFFPQLNWEHLLAVLTHSLASMTIKDSKKSTGLIPGDLVHVTVGVLHLGPKLHIFFLCVAIFLDT